MHLEATAVLLGLRDLEGKLTTRHPGAKFGHLVQALRLSQSNSGKAKAPHGHGHFRKVKATQGKSEQEKADPHGHGHFSKVQEKHEK